MRDVHRSVHPAFGYIWLLINFCDYRLSNSKQNWYLTGTYSAHEHHENRHATLGNFYGNCLSMKNKTEG